MREPNGQTVSNGVNRRAKEVARAVVAPVAELTGRHAELTGREVMFGTEEILVTKTDLTGTITYANDVFLRVAGYSEGDVIGQPHSFIRHPEMPRAIFKLLWEALHGGKEIFAYVVNCAKYGDHYWVFAHVTPTLDANGTVTGYHSSRRCPDRRQVEQVKVLYDRMLAAERQHPRKADAIAASLQILKLAVAEHHQSYEEFVFSI
jgi:PAS domain S-box-containing protein